MMQSQDEDEKDPLKELQKKKKQVLHSETSNKHLWPFHDQTFNLSIVVDLAGDYKHRDMYRREAWDADEACELRSVSFSGPGQEIGHTCKLQPTQSKPNSFQNPVVQCLLQEWQPDASSDARHGQLCRSTSWSPHNLGECNCWGWGALEFWCLLLTLQTEKKPNIYIHVIVKNWCWWWLLLLWWWWCLPELFCPCSDHAPAASSIVSN